jgi:hypothetical protein
MHTLTKQESEMITLNDLREGSTIVVRGAFGTGVAQTATVNCIEEDIKNGLPGIDYTVKATGEQLWAYLTQVQKVVKY